MQEVYACAIQQLELTVNDMLPVCTRIRILCVGNNKAYIGHVELVGRVSVSKEVDQVFLQNRPQCVVA